MGDGSGLDPGALSPEDLEDLVNRSIINLGRPNILMMSPQAFGPIGGLVLLYPEFIGTPWQHHYKLTPREYKLAGLHTTLSKLGLMQLDDFDWDLTIEKSQKRLKRAKWARYQK